VAQMVLERVFETEGSFLEELAQNSVPNLDLNFTTAM